MAADESQKQKWSDLWRKESCKIAHCASLMNLCHLKNSELEPQFQKYKGRVVLRGDIVINDSGSYALFIELWSSASQMTVAKVMDIRSRRPGCAGQAADALFVCTQVKMEDAPSLFKKIRSQNVQIFGYVYQNTNGPNHGPAWKIQLFLLNGICTITFWQDSFEKGKLRKFYWNTDGKSFNFGNVFRLSKKRTILVWVCGRYQVEWKETKSWPNVETTYEKTLIWENQHNSLTVCIWLARNENARWTRIVWRFTQICFNLGFLLVL